MYILSEGKLNETQFLLAKLILLNKMDTSNSTIIHGELDQVYRFALNENLVLDARNGNFGEGYTLFRHLIITKSGQWGSIFSWIPILYVAVAQNHFALCKIIFEQIQKDCRTELYWNGTLCGNTKEDTGKWSLKNILW